MEAVSLSLLVLKTPQINTVREFYEALGLSFVEERHGSGPVHFAATLGTLVIEIYPLPEGIAVPDKTTRLGFTVSDVRRAVESFEARGETFVSPVRDTEWGRRAVIRDPDGRTVELVQR